MEGSHLFGTSDFCVGEWLNAHGTQSFGHRSGMPQ